MKILLFLLLVPVGLFAQKRIEHTYDTNQIEGIHINSDAIFKITISTAKVQEITVHTLIEGETYESSLVNTSIINKHLDISTGRMPDFTPFNDKLSAHKVLSIELAIIVPEMLDIDVRSTLAEVSLQGTYGSIQVNLGRGGFMGKGLRFRESVINTISGNVSLQLDSANVIAGSRNGIATVDSIFNDGPLCLIQSIHGDIEVLQVK